MRSKSLQIIGYVRVSTSKQELSPKAQQDQIGQWCARQGYDLVETFEEKVSGGGWSSTTWTSARR